MGFDRAAIGAFLECKAGVFLEDFAFGLDFGEAALELGLAPGLEAWAETRGPPEAAEIDRPFPGVTRLT